MMIMTNDMIPCRVQEVIALVIISYLTHYFLHLAKRRESLVAGTAGYQVKHQYVKY